MPRASSSSAASKLLTPQKRILPSSTTPSTPPVPYHPAGADARHPRLEPGPQRGHGARPPVALHVPGPLSDDRYLHSRPAERPPPHLDRYVRVPRICPTSLTPAAKEEVPGRGADAWGG